MAINRYYTVDPQIGGLLEFLAGFGQQRNAVKTQEAATQTAIQGQQGQGLARGIESAGQSFGNAISQAALAKFGASNAERNLLTQLAGQRELDTLRADNNLRQAQTAAFLEKYGTSPQAFFTQATSAVGPLPQDTPELQGFEVQQQFVGPQPQMAGPPEPGTTLPGQNPALTPQYRKAKERLDQLNSVAASIDLDNTRSPQERAQMLQALMPHIAEAQQLLQRYPAPRQPTTFAELQAGGAVIPIPGYDGIMTMGEGGYKATTLHPTKSPGQTQTNFTATRADGTTFTIQPGESMEVAPGVWQMRDMDGNLRMFKADQGGEADPLNVDIDDVLKVQKALTTTKLNAKGQAEDDVPSLAKSFDEAMQLKKLMRDRKKQEAVPFQQRMNLDAMRQAIPGMLMSVPPEAFATGNAPQEVYQIAELYRKQLKEKYSGPNALPDEDFENLKRLLEIGALEP